MESPPPPPPLDPNDTGRKGKLMNTTAHQGHQKGVEPLLKAITGSFVGETKHRLSCLKRLTAKHV